MSLQAPLAGIGASLGWGSGDFLAGVASRRVHVLVVATISQVMGLVVLPVAALVLGEAVPAPRDQVLGGLAGVAAAVGIMGLYGALAAGRMGIAAPITGVLAAALPVLYAWSTGGLPSPAPLTGMVLALAGIALVSGPRAHRPPRRVVQLAVAAGLGFAVFLLLMGMSRGSFAWTLVAARIGTCVVLLSAIAVVRPRMSTDLPWGTIVAVGVLILAGDVGFLAATRLGSLDAAVILSSMYPLVTVVLARFALGERLTRLQTVGAALLVIALPLIASA